jgi:hypothetical protein
MRISAAPLTFFFALSVLTGQTFAGDATMWDPIGRRFVAVYSSTPEGGKDYVTGEQAMESVQKAMRKQGVIDPVPVWKSDRTGYFAVCSGINAKKETVVGVGVGKTEAESKVHGLEQLRAAGAETGLYIAHRYESYGSDYTPAMPALVDLNTSPVENEEISSLSPDGHLALCTAHSRGWKLQRLDLMNIQTFEPLLELGSPTTLFGSIVWSEDGKRFAFFGEERAWGETNVYFLEDGKYELVAMPERDKFPEPELEMKPGEHILKVINDAVRPKAWSKSDDLEVEHVVSVMLDKDNEKVATVEAITTMTIHFDENKTASIASVAQTTTRKAIEPDLSKKASTAKPGLTNPGLLNPGLSTPAVSKPGSPKPGL